MEMRIMVHDRGSASALALRLASVFGGDRVTLTHKELTLLLAKIDLKKKITKSWNKYKEKKQ